jgi:hypothetical protein
LAKNYFKPFAKGQIPAPGALLGLGLFPSVDAALCLGGCCSAPSRAELLLEPGEALAAASASFTLSFIA